MPDVVVGHSVGEYSALAAAGALGVAEVIGLVRERGLATAESTGGGGMAAVLELADEQVEELCGGGRRVAGQLQLPRAGGHLRPRGGLDARRRAGARAGRKADPAEVSGAFHSPLVATPPAARPAVQAASFGALQTPFMSTVPTSWRRSTTSRVC